MTAPKLFKNDLIAKIKGFTFPEAVYIVGIRGYYLNSMGKEGENDRGIFDDAIFLVGPNLFKAFNANTDPSKYQKGIATLMPGLHYYRKGKHGITKPGGGYPAFRPDTVDESLPVTRDGKEGIFKGIAINIHSGGLYQTSSAGCQTIYKLQWKDFQETAYKAMDEEGQRRIPYILIENK